MYSLELPHRGDSNENTQYTFMLKIEKTSIFCLLTWRYDKHSLARTTPVSNIFYGSKGVRAIDRSSTVYMTYDIYRKELASRGFFFFYESTLIMKMTDLFPLEMY